MLETKIKIYVCRGMTGRVKEEIVKEAQADKKFLEDAGFQVLCPVSEENVHATSEVLRSSKQAMEFYWPRDKQMIRDAHVLLDMSPHLNSEGVKHELGYGRYFLYRPVIRVFPKGKLPLKSSIAYFEDDFICDSLEEAVEYVYRVHGSLFKRLKWRFQLYKRCLPKMIRYWFQSWK